MVIIVIIQTITNLSQILSQKSILAKLFKCILLTNCSQISEDRVKSVKIIKHSKALNHCIYNSFNLYNKSVKLVKELERSPYKERVRSSSLLTPTIKKTRVFSLCLFYYISKSAHNLLTCVFFERIFHLIQP